MSESTVQGIKNVPDYFGCNVFNEETMKQRLPKNVYKSLLKTKTMGTALDPDVADVIAATMKDWAVEKGVTHYTHWFHPMTGLSAEKHDSFISPTDDGKVIMEFSGKELIKGEPDASSFPSGGLRATFEARGYTAWDPTSPAFIKDNTLYIPTAFCSYTGEVLDKKTPLLRSMEVISEQAVRILKLFGSKATRVTTTVGPEQEYFLVDKKLYDQRKDLIYTGRTLFGAKAPKGQELEDHYFGNIKTRVHDYMTELDEELWKLGIYSKTEHNEVAPAQHEMAPIFTTSNVAADQNALTMEIMKKVALKHGLVCLLHEKPFAGVNGSGKHNNWSISTNDGQNLLDPGKNPKDNIQFLTFLAAIIKAVDENADLLRLSVASAGNDHRLGANEAPPAIMSIFVGSELQQILDALETGEMIKSGANEEFVIGVEALPNFPKDTTDRNRTSPFAFTGNKFEFRSLGSSETIACTNCILNTIVANSLKEFADRLEGAEDFTAELNKLLVETIKKHKRVIFNGNGYDASWVEEAARRGLPNYVSTVDAVPHYTDEKNVKMFEMFKVYTKTELESRTEIILENYSKVINIEALTMLDMAKKQILPAGMEFAKELCDSVNAKKSAGVSADLEKKLADKVTALNAGISEAIDELDTKLIGAGDAGDAEATAKYYRNTVFAAMQSLRAVADELETITPETIWPFPTYGDLMFRV
ncbi:MAG: glutamine synthetase III [Oscillospiraceae bacterium]|nr:glutamine synthetase III [Oscillospiraceae bacterium]MDY6208311.1 glutamine synthetase III [Oscillospiraceae bacterium]